MSQYPFKFLHSILLLKRLQMEGGELGTPCVNQLYSFHGCIY